MPIGAIPASKTPEETRGFSSARAHRRLIGIDVARGLALIGMIVAHAAPRLEPTVWEAVAINISDDRSRLLFALAAGLGLGLLTGGTHPPAVMPGSQRGSPRRVLRRQIAIRAGVLLVIGGALTTLGPLLDVILDEYGIAFLLMLPLVFLSARWLISVGIVGVLVMPGVAWALTVLPDLQLARRGNAGWLVDWMITGSYPVVVWVPVLMLGVGLIRVGIARPRVIAVAGGVGLGAAVAGLTFAALFRGPNPDPLTVSLEVGGNVGVCVALVAALIALTSLTPRGVRRASAAVLSPVAAAGSMPLTIYTTHVVILWASIRTVNGMPTDDSWLTVVLLVVGSLVFAWLWRRFIGRGPLEWLVAVLSGRTGLRKRSAREAA